MHLKTLAVALLGIVIATTCSLAATIRVPLEAPTIQAGVDAAASGDTVLVAAGIYRGEGNKRISFNGRDILLLSESGPTVTLIDIEGFAEPNQAFRIENGETAAAVIAGFQVRNGFLETGAGAGIFIKNSSPTVRNCIFLNNWMGSDDNDVHGGAAAIEDGSPAFIHCYFVNNRVSLFSDLPGLDSTGGAVYCQGGSPQFMSCLFQSNSALGVGGAGSGGAIGGNGSTVVLIDCLLQRNIADVAGGGLSLTGSEVTINNTILAFNESGSIAGGILSSLSSLQIQSCTLHGNSAVHEGGALYLWDSSVMIEKTIVAFSDAGGAIRCVSQGPDIILRCTDIYGNAGGDWTEPCIAAQFGSNGNFALDPLFCAAISGDFRLNSASPCAPGNAPPGCGLIGARDVGCGTTAVQDAAASPAVNALRILENPALGSAEFEISPAPGQMLEIYAVGGRLVDRLQLLDESSTVVWKPSASTSPGIYFASLRPGRGGPTVKFILLRD